MSFDSASIWLFPATLVWHRPEFLTWHSASDRFPQHPYRAARAHLRAAVHWQGGVLKDESGVHSGRDRVLSVHAISQKSVGRIQLRRAAAVWSWWWWSIGGNSGLGACKRSCAQEICSRQSFEVSWRGVPVGPMASRGVVMHFFLIFKGCGSTQVFITLSCLVLGMPPDGQFWFALLCLHSDVYMFSGYRVYAKKNQSGHVLIVFFSPLLVRFREMLVRWESLVYLKRHAENQSMSFLFD